LINLLQEFLPELGDLDYLGNKAPDQDWFGALFMSEFIGCNLDEDENYWQM
jgi:hypothetical protein